MRTIIAVMVAAMTLSSPAFARVNPLAQPSNQNLTVTRIFGMEVNPARSEPQPQQQPQLKRHRYYDHYWRHIRTVRHRGRTAVHFARAARAVQPQPQEQGWSLFGLNFYSPVAPVGNERLLHVAEHYVGRGNFTGFNGKWCAAAAGLWLKEAGYTRLGSLAAIDYARYGRPADPRPGVVAVLPHHIGVVAKVYPTSILLLSGNHRHNVGYGVVSKRSIVAFRQPV